MNITPAQMSVLRKVAAGNNSFGGDKVAIRNLRNKGLITTSSHLVHNRGCSSYWRITVTLTEAGKASI